MAVACHSSDDNGMHDTYENEEEPEEEEEMQKMQKTSVRFGAKTDHDMLSLTADDDDDDGKDHDDIK